MTVIWRCPTCESPVRFTVDAHGDRAEDGTRTVYVDVAAVEQAIHLHLASHKRQSVA